MESLLHYVWRYKLYPAGTLQTIQGFSLEIIDPGIYNTNAGPDFFNAKIKIDNRIWVGNVEIHCRASDWYRHNHEKDKAYESVILHVVEVSDKEVENKKKQIIPQWEMPVSKYIRDNYHTLIHSTLEIPCSSKLINIDSIYISDWKNALLSERLERKTNSIQLYLEQYKNDWNEVFYITLARYFGFGINNDIFERLAKSLPLYCIGKHADSSFQVEALFFGQAGLLEESIEDEYYRSLQKEYLFLRKKYKLNPLEAHNFKSLRMRPNNFPHIKIAQLANLVRSVPQLFSKLLIVNNIRDYAPFFISELPEYWMTHYLFGKESPRKPKVLGNSAIQILLINVLVPILFAYGKEKGSIVYMEKAFQLLESLPPERNHIITNYSQIGLKANNAADTQAIIQLKKEYCEKKKCIYCRIGFRLLAK